MTVDEAIKQTKTMVAAAKLCGIPFTTFVRYAKELGLYNPNQGAKGTNKPVSNKLKTQDILNGNYPKYSTNKLKKRLIKENILKLKCVDCGITDTWNSRPIVLHLDHINGKSNDHRLINLRLLCPNCHSQTDTYCGKNKSRRSPTAEANDLESFKCQFESDRRHH